jgi:uncharacterized membrane protein
VPDEKMGDNGTVSGVGVASSLTTSELKLAAAATAALTGRGPIKNPENRFITIATIKRIENTGFFTPISL